MEKIYRKGAIGALMFAALISFAVNWQMQSAIDEQMERNQYLTWK